MDRLGQADAILSMLGASGDVGVVAGRAVSPMDCQRTIPVARETIAACQAAATPPDAAADPVVDPEMLRAASGVVRPDRARPRSA